MATQTPSRSPAVAAALVDIADTMVDDFDIVDLLHRVTRHCVELLGIDAAGILLADGQGTLRFVAASSEQARLVELFQLQAEEGGPCVECFRTGAPVNVTNLARWQQHWPGFVTEAEREGFHSVYARPLRLREQTIGGLNLFRIVTGALSRSRLTLAQALADMATIAIVQYRTLTLRDTLVEQLEAALHSRVVIEQAKGALSYRAGIHVDEAFEHLRRYARTHHLQLSKLAGDVVTDDATAHRILDFARQRHESQSPAGPAQARRCR